MWKSGVRSSATDGVVGEEPLEIRVRAGEDRRTLGLTMRTPGNDFELVAGFLKGEGVVTAREDIRAIRYCTDPGIDEAQMYNVVTAELSLERLPDGIAMERHFHAGSACGVCGKATLDDLSLAGHEAITTKSACRCFGRLLVARPAARAAGAIRRDRRPACRRVVPSRRRDDRRPGGCRTSQRSRQASRMGHARRHPHR